MTALVKWTEEVDAYMLKHYCVTMSGDVGAGEEELAQAMSDGMMPQEYCEWIARKFDLEPRSEMLANWGAI